MYGNGLASLADFSGGMADGEATVVAQSGALGLDPFEAIVDLSRWPSGDQVTACLDTLEPGIPCTWK